MGRTDHGMEYFSSPLTLGIGVTGVPEQSQDQSAFSVQMVVHLESIQKISSPSLERNLLTDYFPINSYFPPG